MGEEICINGLAASNDYFLLKRGFVHPFRGFRVDVAAKLSEQDPMFADKKALMRGMTARRFRIPDSMNDPEFMNYVMFLRYFTWSGSRENLQLLRQNEIARKTNMKEPFNESTAFLGT
jgi:hypothetical protein